MHSLTSLSIKLTLFEYHLAHAIFSLILSRVKSCAEAWEQGCSRVALMLFVYLCCLDCSGGNATICNDNSSCDSNEMCECDQSYFSPSGTNTDCRAQRQPPAGKW